MIFFVLTKSVLFFISPMSSIAWFVMCAIFISLINSLLLSIIAQAIEFLVSLDGFAP